MCVRGILLVGVALTLSSVVPAAAASWLEMNFYLSGPRYDGLLPGCAVPAALGKISARVSEKEARFWNSNLAILEFEQVSETAFRPWAANAIPRRFCSAVAVVSDGLRRRVHYSIGEDAGMIGMTWRVAWCVVGLDRNWAYNPRCKMARP